MNRFRVNLHPALFVESVSEAPETREQCQIDLESELLNLKTDVELDNMSYLVLSEMTSSYGDYNQLMLDRQRFVDRLKAKNGEKTYDRIWDKKIEAGYEQLLKSLENEKYFGKGKDSTVATAKKLYVKEVKKQYKNNIWYASDKKFNSVKDTLFGEDSPDYPADKVYKKLTGAATIRKIERTYVEGYGSDILSSATQTEGGPQLTESFKEKEVRKFLSNDLPEYLWDIKKTPGILKALNWLPIFSLKEDRPSKEDKKRINDFMEVASKISVESGKDKAFALLEALKDNRISYSSSPSTYKQVLQSRGITIEDKDLKKIVKVGGDYLKTQQSVNDIKDQHAIYLSILQIISESGGAVAATAKYKSIVEQAKKDKKAEKKEGYEKEETLRKNNPELYNIAKQLGITDFTSVNRLSKLPDTYFADNSVEQILANLNNDNALNPRDTIIGGSKTGKQFLEVFKVIGKEKALPNLSHHAKLLNNTLSVGLDDTKLNKNNIEQYIHNGHKDVILLLQNIINKPGEDLYTLLSKDTSKAPFEGLNLDNERGSADKYAEEMLKKMDLDKLHQSGLRLPNPENLQSGLATALYTEYKRGIGLGGKISFDQWVKGLDMSTGFQVRNDGTVIVGLGLNYGKKIDLGKGWSTTPELSAGTFIPLFKGKPELSGSVGFNNEIARDWITNSGVQQHLGLKGGVTLMPLGVTVISAGFNWEQDKVAGIETAEQKKMVEFKDQIIKPLLDAVSYGLNLQPNNSTVLDFSVPWTRRVIEHEIQKIAKQQNVPEKDQKMVTDAVMRLLVNYNGANLSQNGVIDMISQSVAEQYAMAWSEYRKSHVSDKAYLSGATLGAFWVAGSPLVGIHAGIRFTKHDLDGYGDILGAEHKLDSVDNLGWDTDTINTLNQRLGLSDSNGLELTTDGYINVPSSITHRIKVSGDMKGFMKKDENGNVTLSKWTTMREDIMQGSATRSKELYIGDGPKFETHLDAAGSEWFNQDLEQVNNGVLEKANSLLYTPENLRLAIAKLKLSAQGVLGGYNPTDAEIRKIVNLLKKASKDSPSNKLRLIIEKNGEKFSPSVEDTNTKGKGIELQFRNNLEMFDSEAKKIADSVYERAAKLDNPVALNRVKHSIGREMQTYKDFVTKLNVGDYDVAKGELEKIITELNKSYTGNKAFPQIESWPEGEALGQLLMSINNIFARSTKVQGKGSEEEAYGNKLNQYAFTTQMGSIIAERERQIGGTLQDKITKKEGEDGNYINSVKQAYGTLMSKMMGYRKRNSNTFNKQNDVAAHLNNTVGFNLGDQTKPENPLLNPEIYSSGMVSAQELGLESNDQNVLHTRAIKNFITNDALFNPLKRALGLQDTDKVDIAKKSDGSYEELANGKIELDIGGKKITLGSEIKFGYFTQCVNHTVILTDISVEDKNGNTMNFGSGSWENGRYVEGNKSSIVATTTYNFGIAFTARGGNDEPKNGARSDPGLNGQGGPTDGNKSMPNPNGQGGGTSGDNVGL